MDAQQPAELSQGALELIHEAREATVAAMALLAAPQPAPAVEEPAPVVDVSSDADSGGEDSGGEDSDEDSRAVFRRQKSDVRLDLRSPGGGVTSFYASWFVCGRSSVLRHSAPLAKTRDARGRHILELDCPVPVAAVVRALGFMHGMGHPPLDDMAPDVLKALDWLDDAAWHNVSQLLGHCFKTPELGRRVPEALQVAYLQHCPALPEWMDPRFLHDLGVDTTPAWHPHLERWKGADTRFSLSAVTEAMFLMQTQPDNWRLCVDLSLALLSKDIVMQCAATVFGVRSGVLLGIACHLDMLTDWVQPRGKSPFLLTTPNHSAVVIWDAPALRRRFSLETSTGGVDATSKVVWRESEKRLEFRHGVATWLRADNNQGCACLAEDDLIVQSFTDLPSRLIVSLF